MLLILDKACAHVGGKRRDTPDVKQHCAVEFDGGSQDLGFRWLVRRLLCFQRPSQRETGKQKSQNMNVGHHEVPSRATVRLTVDGAVPSRPAKR